MIVPLNGSVILHIFTEMQVLISQALPHANAYLISFIWNGNARIRDSDVCHQNMTVMVTEKCEAMLL